MEKTGYAADALIEHLREKHLTLGFAESCTGGLAAAAVVAVPGASACNGEIPRHPRGAPLGPGAIFARVTSYASGGFAFRDLRHLLFGPGARRVEGP